MSNPSNDDDPESSGFTDQQEAAIIATLEAVGLKPDVNIQKILFSIVQVVDAVAGGGAHPKNVLYEGGIQDDLTGLLAKLDAAEQAYDRLDDALQANIEAQRRIPERCAECAL